MTLKTARPTGLKKLKAIIGHRGESFAKLVGVPYDTLKSVESGRKKMSDDVARKIKIATGVLVESLAKRTPKTIAGGEYNEAYFIQWRARVLSLDKNKVEARKRAEEQAEYIGFFTKVLLLAAVENGKAVTYGSLHLEIASLIGDLAKQHNLDAAIQKVLERFPIRAPSPEYTGREWKTAPDYLREFYGVTADRLRRMEDFKQYPLTATVFPIWQPEGGVDEQALRPKSC